MIFGSTSKIVAKFQLIDGLLLNDHYHLSPDDECYFYLEYTSGQNYKFSQANQLIINLKKKPSTKGTYQWPHKIKAMAACSRALLNGFNHDWLKDAVLVPVPPSKAKSDPEYDDRMKVICEQIDVPFEIDVRELVTHDSSHEAVHEGGNRLSPDELVDIFEIDENLATPEPTKIVIVDDVLTAGSHYRAMHRVLSKRFPNARIFGFFIARRVFATKKAADDFVSIK